MDQKRVAIIGAGPGGIIALKTFLDSGFRKVTVFERRSVPGGVWTLDEQLGYKPETLIPDIGKNVLELDPPHSIPREAIQGTVSSPIEIEDSSSARTKWQESALYPQLETNASCDNLDTLDVTFTDGSELKGVDKLVFGTGYIPSYPFLADYWRKLNLATGEQVLSIKNLYWNTWWNLDSSLAISSAFSETIFWPAIETQAIASSILWKSDRAKRGWPSTVDLQSYEKEIQKIYDQKYPFHLYPHFDSWFRGITRAVSDQDQFPALIPALNYANLLPKAELSQRLKVDYATRVAQETLKVHPEWQPQYERTLKVLEQHKVSLYSPKNKITGRL